MKTLREVLDHEPAPLRFGTSGRRGRVRDLTQLEVYLNARAELEYLLAQPPEAGGIQAGQEFFLGHDLRPSSTAYVPEQGGRGELAQAIARAIEDVGLKPVNLGPLPTPAVLHHGLCRRRGSIMVTGSHIPFDRNGYKTHSARGELRKEDEAPINARVAALRERLYAQPAEESPFAPDGRFKSGSRPLPPAEPGAAEEFLRRYLDFFPANCLQGLRLLVFQHSAVGRDLLVEVLERLGAEVIPAGRSETFVPIDTENVSADLLADLRRMVTEAAAERGAIDAVVSTDGDSDRPLLVSVSGPAEAPEVRFHGGDLLGMVVAEQLAADAVVVPISCNDGIDRGPLRDRLEPKTRIGSPYVIAGMEAALAKGRRRVCGWEANGGFLLGSDLEQDGRPLSALPSRDSFLPLLTVLRAAARRRTPVEALFDALPAPFSKAALLREFPRPTSLAIVARLAPPREEIVEADLTTTPPGLRDREGRPLDATEADARRLAEVRATVEGIFNAAAGFGPLARLNYLDGVRMIFANGDVAHVRPSGNADELRIYAVADTQERADAIAREGVREPDGLLRQLERLVT